MVFQSVMAEEQDLFGSAYCAQTPIYPAAITIADIILVDNTFRKTMDV